MIKLLKIIIGIIIFLVVSVIIFGIVIIVLNRNNKPKKQERPSAHKTTTATIVNVNVDVKDSAIKVVKAKTDYVKFYYYESNTRTFDFEETYDEISGTLDLNLKGYQTGKWYNRIMLTLKFTKVYDTVIEVPDGVNLVLKTDNGLVTLDDFDPLSVKAQTTNGNIKLTNINTLGAELEATHGRITCENSNLLGLKAVTGNGKIILKDGDITVLDAQSKNGSILLDHIKSTSILSNLKVSTDNGDITLDNSTSEGDMSLHTGKGDIKGTIKNLKSYYEITQKAKNGTSNIENTTEGTAKLTVTTDNGNIELSFKGV